MDNFFDFLNKAAANLPKPEYEPLPEPEPVFYCVECCDHKVTHEGEKCEQCKIDERRGYRVSSLAGRCANGAERDHGTRYHAVRTGEYKAVCGAEPGRRSVGWCDWGYGGEVTCPRCLKRLEK